METISYSLAELVEKTRFEDLSPEVIHEAKRRIADVIGIGLSGSSNPVSENINKFLSLQNSSGNASVWGTNMTASPAYASLANGTMIFHLELDDVHRTSHTHPGVSVIPGALAVCEENNLSGKDLLLSTVLGYEVIIRVGLSVSPSIYVDRSYLAPGTLAVFGATAAAAKLQDLDIESIAGALGTASYVGSLAPFETFRLGASAKDTIMGWANLTGLYSVDLESSGFSGPATSIEGDFGYCNTVTESFDVDRVRQNLGNTFEILNTGIKPYACCRQHHTAVDAMLDLRNNYDLEPEKVKSISHRTFVVGSRGSEKEPTSIPAAKYSAPYTIASTLTYGKAWREQYTMDLIQDKELLELASKVEVSADEELEALYDEKWPSLVEVTMKDGQVLSSRRDLPKGEPEHPLTDKELKDKFLSLATDSITPERAEKIWNTIFQLDDLNDISVLSNLLQR